MPALAVMPAARLRAASLAASLALHAALVLVVAHRAAVPLVLEREMVLVDLVETARRTAGPGLVSDQLRVAAPAVTDVPPPASADVAPAEVAPSPAPAPPRPQVAKPAEASRPRAEPSPRRTVETPAAPAVTAPDSGASPAAGQGSTASAGATGRDTVSTAPAWAPTARVRYEQLLYAWIEKHKEYPLLARRRGLEGEGSVRVRIDRGGRLVENVLVRSTGDATLDRAALDMVRRASPFPRVPDDYAGDSFEFVAPVEYRLR